MRDYKKILYHITLSSLRQEPTTKSTKIEYQCSTSHRRDGQTDRPTEHPWQRARKKKSKPVNNQAKKQTVDMPHQHGSLPPTGPRMKKRKKSDLDQCQSPQTSGDITHRHGPTLPPPPTGGAVAGRDRNKSRITSQERSSAPHEHILSSENKMRRDIHGNHSPRQSPNGSYLLRE